MQLCKHVMYVKYVRIISADNKCICNKDNACSALTQRAVNSTLQHPRGARTALMIIINLVITAMLIPLLSSSLLL